MEIAINTIVVMILGAIVLGGGVLLLMQLLDKSSGLPDTLSTSQINTLNRMMSDGDLVAVMPQNQRSVNGKAVVYGVGIDNRLGVDEQFTITVRYSADNPGGTAGLSNWVMKSFPTQDVKANDRETIAIAVGQAKGKTIPPGVYTFLVNVTYGTPAKLYDSTRFFTVTVS